MPLNIGKKKVVGVDLGHKVIRVVEIDRGSHGWQLGRVGTAAMPEGAIRDGVITDTEAAGFALKAALQDAGISASNAHLAAAGGSVSVRTVRIPKMAESALRKSIRIEAGRYVPGSIEDSYIEFEIVGLDDEGQMEVLVVAAPKEVVESRIAACEKAGLDVESVDIEVFAAYRALIEADQNNGWDDKTVALIDIGGFSTNVAVIQNGQFAMTRTIAQGGQLLSEALKNYFKLSEDDAESGKSQLDVSLLIDDATPKENPPLRVIQPHVDDLVREIRRSLNYYQSQQTEAKKTGQVEAILVTGGGAKLPGLSEYMAHKLGIPTIAAGIFDNPRFSISGADEPGKGMDLSVATGLAMRAHARTEKVKVA